MKLLVASALLSIALASCGGGGNTTTESVKPTAEDEIVQVVPDIVFTGTSVTQGGQLVLPYVHRSKLITTPRVPESDTQLLNMDFVSRNYFAINASGVPGAPSGHVAIVMGQQGDIATQVTGRGFIFGDLRGYSNSLYGNNGSTVVPSLHIETYMGLGPVANNILGSNSAPKLEDDVTYHVEARVYDEAGKTPTIDVKLYQGGALIQTLYMIDTYNPNRGGDGFIIAEVFSGNPGWSVEFTNITLAWVKNAPRE
jgi:hypothetical protein